LDRLDGHGVEPLLLGGGVFHRVTMARLYRRLGGRSRRLRSGSRSCSVRFEDAAAAALATLRASGTAGGGACPRRARSDGRLGGILLRRQVLAHVVAADERREGRD